MPRKYAALHSRTNGSYVIFQDDDESEWYEFIGVEGTMDDAKKIADALNAQENRV